MMTSPVAFAHPTYESLASAIQVRQNIAEAAGKTELAFDTSNAAKRPEGYWTYSEEDGFTLLPGKSLIAALRKATQPEVSGRCYDFSCYRASEYVILLGIAEELQAHNPALLARLQRQWEISAIQSGAFHDTFLIEYGSMESPLPPRFYVPGDRLWFRNPDDHSSDAEGYEGSWVIYLGNGLFSNFWARHQPYTLTSKCVEIYHWRHGTYTDRPTGTYSGDAVTEWVFNAERQEGDLTLIESGDNYYVVLFHSRGRNDYNTVDVRHILFKVDTSSLDSKADDYQAKLEELKAGKKQEAENALQAWKAGDATEESFAALANKLSEDPGSNTNGGLYKQVYKGQMVSEFNDWCFDESRKAGDTGIVANDAAGGSYIGYHVMYFVGTDDPYWMVQVRNAMTNKAYSEWSANLVKDITATENSGMKYVG